MVMARLHDGHPNFYKSDRKNFYNLITNTCNFIFLIKFYKKAGANN